MGKRTTCCTVSLIFWVVFCPRPVQAQEAPAVRTEIEIQADKGADLGCGQLLEVYHANEGAARHEAAVGLISLAPFDPACSMPAGLAETLLEVVAQTNGELLYPACAWLASRGRVDDALAELAGRVLNRPSATDGDVRCLERFAADRPDLTLNLVGSIIYASGERTDPRLLDLFGGTLAQRAHLEALDMLAFLHEKGAGLLRAEVEAAACRLPMAARFEVTLDGVLASARRLADADPADAAVTAAYLRCAAFRPVGADYVLDEALLELAANALAIGVESRDVHTQQAASLALARLLVADTVANGRPTLVEKVPLHQWNRLLGLAHAWLFSVLDTAGSSRLLPEAEQQQAFADLRVFLAVDAALRQEAARRGGMREFLAGAAAHALGATVLSHLPTLLNPGSCEGFLASAELLADAFSLVPRDTIVEQVAAEHLDTMSQAAAEYAGSAPYSLDHPSPQTVADPDAMREKQQCQAAVEQGFRLLSVLVRLDVWVAPLTRLMGGRESDRALLARVALLQGLWLAAATESEVDGFAALMALGAAHPSLLVVHRENSVPSEPWSCEVTLSTTGGSVPAGRMHLMQEHGESLLRLYGQAGPEHLDTLVRVLSAVPLAVARRVLADLSRAALDQPSAQELLELAGRQETGLSAALRKDAREQARLVELERAERAQGGLSPDEQARYSLVRDLDADRFLLLAGSLDQPALAALLDFVAGLKDESTNAREMLEQLAYSEPGQFTNGAREAARKLLGL